MITIEVWEDNNYGMPEFTVEGETLSEALLQLADIALEYSQ